MINLADEQFNVNEGGDFKIFNGGKAGLVTGCTGRLTKKTAADPDNAPDYKLFITDKDGGEVNYGMFKNIKDTQLNFKGKELRHLASRFDYNCVMQGASYGELLDKNAVLLKDAIEGKVFDVVASYGTEGYPKKYIQLNSLFDIKSEGDTYINPKYIMVRPEADDVARNANGDAKVASGGEKDDLPW